jgi:hypothetical protein
MEQKYSRKFPCLALQMSLRAELTGEGPRRKLSPNCDHASDRNMTDLTKKALKVRKKLEKKQRKLEKKLRAVEQELRALREPPKAAPKTKKALKRVAAKAKKKRPRAPDTEHPASAGAPEASLATAVERTA